MQEDMGFWLALALQGPAWLPNILDRSVLTCRETARQKEYAEVLTKLPDLPFSSASAASFDWPRNEDAEQLVVAGKFQLVSKLSLLWPGPVAVYDLQLSDGNRYVNAFIRVEPEDYAWFNKAMNETRKYQAAMVQVTMRRAWIHNFPIFQVSRLHFVKPVDGIIGRPTLLVPYGWGRVYPEADAAINATQCICKILRICDSKTVDDMMHMDGLLPPRFVEEQTAKFALAPNPPIVLWRSAFERCRLPVLRHDSGGQYTSCERSRRCYMQIETLGGIEWVVCRDDVKMYDGNGLITTESRPLQAGVTCMFYLKDFVTFDLNGDTEEGIGIASVQYGDPQLYCRRPADKMVKTSWRQVDKVIVGTYSTLRMTRHFGNPDVLSTNLFVSIINSSDLTTVLKR